jgi:hypothetical protein
MSSIGTLSFKRLARLIGEPTARTRFRRTNNIAGRDTSDQPPLRKIGLSARHPT